MSEHGVIVFVVTLSAFWFLAAVLSFFAGYVAGSAAYRPRNRPLGHGAAGDPVRGTRNGGEAAS